ncbi:MAG: hypothetical protein IAE83_03330 [Anaerolinea sp.]|nr:hypothetical protein [Anaerolinea sp.]
MSANPENPFALLKLPTTCTKEAVIEKGEEMLHEMHHDPDSQAAIRQAVQQIVTHPDERALYAALEIPDTDYEPYDHEWDRFARRFRRSPITPEMIRPLAEMFIEEQLHPDQLLSLLGPLLKANRPGPSSVLLPDAPAVESPPPLRPGDLFRG